MPGMLQVTGRFSVPWSVQDASGKLYPGAFLFAENAGYVDLCLGFKSLIEAQFDIVVARPLRSNTMTRGMI